MDKNSVKPLKEVLDSVRDIDGFPIGKDEDIIALSDPPFYTACPNSYIKEFIEEYGTPYDSETDDYHREPFVGDVSEGKNDPIYSAHSYHTKVPHKAIMRYIEHYTESDDIVFDGFCGTGMTGVSASLLQRKAIISDLSTVAAFVAHNYNNPIDPKKFEKYSTEMLAKINQECSWMYKTFHPGPMKIDENLVNGNIDYTVWSDILSCPYCEVEFTFYNAAFDEEAKAVKTDFQCPHCNANLTKRDCNRVYETIFDSVIGKDIEILKEKPILIVYKVGTDRFEKEPDENDLKTLEKIKNIEIPYWYPTIPIPPGDKTQEFIRLGFTHSHHLYSKRALYAISLAFHLIEKEEIEYRPFLRFTFEQMISGMSKIARYVPTHYSQVNQYLSGTIYVSSLRVDPTPGYIIENKIKRLVKALEQLRKTNTPSITSTQSVTDFPQIKDNTIDYIFTDPPFGSNLMYSELNYLIESWLKVLTNNQKEAIVNRTQNKELNDYNDLMSKSFREMYRILKPNRWITIEFHNSSAAVWNSIQEAITRSGFIIAQVAVLDKKQGSFNQVTAAGAVKNDLVINAYKPREEFAERFLRNAGEGMEVDFITEQMSHLPVRPNIGRTEKMLYSKMLAHYVENGFKIKYNSTNFYKLLFDNFTELDGYWFLDSQVKEYNKWKSSLSLDELREKLSGQQVLIITDEKSALTWMYYFLGNPHTYSDIYTKYQQVAITTDDVIPELKELLENNFILEDGTYRRPLSESEKAEVEKNQEKELERAFNKLLKHAKEGKGKIKNVRREALVYGFTKCYQEGRYQDILAVANKLYASTLEASGEIMDFVDIAKIKTAGEKKMTIDDY